MCSCRSCLKCLCKYGIIVCTCSCFAPSDPPPLKDSDDDDKAALLDESGHEDDVKQPPFDRLKDAMNKHTPSLLGNGHFARHCYYISGVWRALCSLLCCLLPCAYSTLHCVLKCIAKQFPCYHTWGCDDDEYEWITEDDPRWDQAEGEEEQQAKRLTDQMKALIGRGPDPPDSTWLHMDRLNPDEDEREPMGKLCISVEIYPMDVAKQNPAGRARRSPNQNPYLPPPVGRLRWSWNPFVLGSQICGPKLCAYFTCLIICTGFILLMIYCQPALNVMIWILTNCLIPG